MSAGKLCGQIWEQLRGKAPHYHSYLESARIDGLRGISGLEVRFPYPVSVIAGPNSCGKSTVLFALAGACKVPGKHGGRRYAPSALFPDFRPQGEHSSDAREPVTLDSVSYTHLTLPTNREV